MISKTPEKPMQSPNNLKIFKFSLLMIIENAATRIGRVLAITAPIPASIHFIAVKLRPR